MDRDRVRGLAVVLGAALAAAVMGILAKEALKRGSDAQSLLTVRYIVTAAALGTPLLVMRSFPLSRRSAGLSVAIGVCMFIGGTCEFQALARLPVSVVIVILFLSPLWIAVHTQVVRRQRLGPARQLAFLVVFAGVVLLVGPRFGDYDMLGLAFALSSSLSFATTMILIQAGRGIEGFSPPAAVAAGAVVGGCLALISQPGAVATELVGQDNAWLVLAMGVAAALGFGLLALGMRAQHVFDVSVVAASEPLFVVALAAVFLGERLGAWQLVGVVLVATGVTLITRTKQLSLTVATRPTSVR